MGSEHELGASATSGAGGGAVGIAGSVAIDIENINTNASLDGTLNAGAGDVRIAAASNATTATEALPTGAGVTGVGSVGIGASVGVAVIDDKTTANLNGSLTGGHDLTLASSTTHAATVSAKTGAAGGKVAVVPSVAIAISNVTTTATVVDGNTLDPSGDFSATADQTASAHTTALGDAEGSSAAIGVSLALVIANHRVEATLLRDIDATGGVGLGAHGASGSSATARASAAGAPEGSSEGGHAGNGVDQQVAGERSFASDTSTANGGDGSGGAESTPTASTSGGGVDIAAAVAINLATSISRATIGAITVHAGGRFALSTSADTDAQATADGSAVQPADSSAPTDSSAPADSSGGAGAPSDSSGGGVSIGAAVAINYDRITNEALLPADASVSAHGAAVEALVTNGGLSGRGASAMSGAGGGAVGIAGSVAIDIENSHTVASIDGVLDAADGDVKIAAASNTQTETNALPSKETGGVTGAKSVGIGASVAVSILDDLTLAELPGTLNGGADIELDASTTHLATTNAKTGAAGGKVAVVPSVAIVLSNITTIATVSSGNGLDVDGAFSASADQTASAHTSAEGSAEGSSAAIGVSLALTIANHRTEATLYRDLDAGGAVSLSAHGASDSSASAVASAAGAPQDESGAADPTDNTGHAGTGVSDQVEHERGFASQTSVANGGDGSGDAASTPAASTSGGGVSVAAAVAINLAKTISLATIGAITIHAGGLFTLSSSADTDAQATADGSAGRSKATESPADDSSGDEAVREEDDAIPGGGGGEEHEHMGGAMDGSGSASAGSPSDSSTSGVTIGAAVAINYVRVINEAILPSGATVTADGATLEAVMTDDGTNTLSASATSGAGGGAVGIAGSVAIEIENIQTTARMAGTLTAGSGDVAITATSDSETTTDALPEGAGVSGVGSVGIGASVAVTIIDDTTTAELTGTLSGGHDLALAASTTHLATTHAKTGASGGKVAVVPSVAIAISDITTTAHVSSGTDLVITGSFSATADQTASAETTAEGDAQGKSAAIGVSLALTIANHIVEARLSRNLTAAGAVTLAANGSSETSATAKASAAGAPEDGSAAAAPSDSTGHASNGVSDQVAHERSFAGSTSTANGGNGTGSAENTPEAKTSNGGVSVAAAVAINLAKVIARAVIDGIVIVTTGLFSLLSSAHANAHATADGSAVQPPTDSSAPADSTSGGSGAPSDSGNLGVRGIPSAPHTRTRTRPPTAAPSRRLRTRARPAIRAPRPIRAQVGRAALRATPPLVSRSVWVWRSTTSASRTKRGHPRTAP